MRYKIKSMNVIIPLGGIGQRFKDHNYKLPKALIKIFGKPILYYLLDSLKVSHLKKIIIPYHLEYARYNLESQLKKDYPNYNFQFYRILQNTRGAAETLYHCLTHIDVNLEESFLSLDGDTFYHRDLIKLWQGKNSVFTFEDTHGSPIYSYVKINNNNIVSEIKEKEYISKNACSGAYGFSSGKLLLEGISHILEHNLTYKNEFYISRVIQYLITQKNEFVNINISNSDFTCLGTPIQVMNFYHNYPRISCLNHHQKFSNYRYCLILIIL